MNDELQQKLISRIKAVKNKADLKTLLSNAVRLYGEIRDPDIQKSIVETQTRFGVEAAAARKKVVPAVPANAFERAVAAALSQYEELRTAEDERAYRATRIRALYDKHGYVEATRRLIHNQASDAFEFLAKRGRLDLSTENLAIQYPEKFDSSTIALARQRLAGVEAAADGG
jgi:hypothetical protein